MDLSLQGKRALVTGSTAGIGFAIARRLAAEGATVILTGRDPARLDRALAELRERVPAAQVSGFAGDLTRADTAAALTAAHPDVEVLINNLGSYGPQDFAAISDEDWRRMIDINFTSGMRLARFYLPRMLAADAGRIQFIASESAFDVPAEMIHYGVTKTMQVALARGLAKLCAGTGVTVNSLLPGPTYTEGVEEFIAAVARERGIDAAAVEQGFFTETRPNSLLRRFISPDEVAAFSVYLASPLAQPEASRKLLIESVRFGGL